MPSNARKKNYQKKKNRQKKEEDAARRHAQTSTAPLLDDSVEAPGAGTIGEQGDSPVKVPGFLDIADNTHKPEDAISPLDIIDTKASDLSDGEEINIQTDATSITEPSTILEVKEKDKLIRQCDMPIPEDIAHTVNEEKRSTEFPLHDRKNKVFIQRKGWTSWMSCCGVFEILRNIFRS